MTISPLAGRPVEPSALVDVAKLVTAYYAEIPDLDAPAQRVRFGTSGHRGSAFDRAFNERHILAITQAICRYRAAHGVTGPLFLGRDTHALSAPAFASALEVLAANGVTAMLAADGEYTPTPAISHAILAYNRGRADGWADGIVITPSHNPPEDGGFKYNPPHGGPAASGVTGWIEAEANRLLAEDCGAVKRIPYRRALGAPSTHRYDYRRHYVEDLARIIDMPAIAAAGIRIGVDPLGGAGAHYWPAIAERYRLNLHVVNDIIDPTFRFISADWDGRIRSDPSSRYAMTPLLGLKDKFDIAFACDADHDRHGIVTRTAGLLPANQFLAVCIEHLFTTRTSWSKDVAVGKTVVSSSMLDRVAGRLGRTVYEVPVGFKWFVDGLLAGRLGFAGEESAGASFLRTDGTTWTTDKDGIIAGLLAAEMTACGRDPGERYRDLTRELGDPVYGRLDTPAGPAERAALQALASGDFDTIAVAGEPALHILTTAPGDGNPIGGVKVIARNGWFAVRPSGTEDICKIYAESYVGPGHLRQIETDAQATVARALARRLGRGGPDATT